MLLMYGSVGWKVLILFIRGIKMLLVLPDELVILRDMRPLDRDIFNYLAERVDFKTGIIGRSRRVSYGGMAFDLSERDTARRIKSTLFTVTHDQVRNSVKRLINQCLLASLSKQGEKCDLILKRVYFADLLSLHDSVKNPVASQLPEQLTRLICLLSLNNNKIDEIRLSSEQGRISSVAITSLHQHQQADDRFLMTMDWQPSEIEMAMVLQRAGGFTMAKVQPEWVAEFVSFWWGEGKRLCNQREWTAKLSMQIVSYLRNPDRFEVLHGISKKSDKTSSTANSEHLPVWAKPPRDDGLLVSWMHNHAYGDPAPGLNYKDARAFLQRAINIRLEQRRKGLS